MLPNLSLFWVVALVLILVVVLDRLLFRPIVRVIGERERRVAAARDLAEQSGARAETAAAEVESKTAAVRAELSRLMEERRRRALEHRAALLARTREEAESMVAAATERLRAEAAEARVQLAREVDSLGAAIAERILGYPAA